MARTVSIGAQDFEALISRNNFYIDKTHFIKEWWENDDIVTLLTRPRRFGKTLNMSMLKCFFSLEYEGRGEIFENLSIWQEEKYRKLQGTYPVLFLSFAGVKANNYLDARAQIIFIFENLYTKYAFLKRADILEENEKCFWNRVGRDMTDGDVVMALHQLSCCLCHYYGKKVIILLDEYDTPMQEAYVCGYWDEIVSLMRNIFNNTFKTNPYMERAVMTGITRVSKESLFSDLNNLKVVSITNNKYASCFGFTEEEVFAAMDEFGLANKEEVKKWYDGFTVGNLHDVYNPWSIINFLDEGELRTYWANTSSNALAGILIRQGDKNLKMQFESLLKGETIFSRIHEEIIFNQLDGSSCSVWSLLLAAGYLKVMSVHGKEYELSLTNYEVQLTFEDMVLNWFGESSGDYNDFVKALLRGNLKEMNAYMNRIAISMFSSFDGGNHPSELTNPERFYHGFVLGLLVELAGRYEVTSNRESGFGRYDVMLYPLNQEDCGIILEFKVYDPEEESSLAETVQAALLQIEEKKYEQALLDRGVEKGRIHKYGFAFEGKKVRIG